MAELERILLTKLQMPEAQVKEVVATIAEHSEVVAPTEPAKWPKQDPDDQGVVAAAVIGTVDTVVSGDSDLLDSPEQDRFQVVTPREFWESLEDRSYR